MTAPALFRQADAERLFAAARKAGLKPQRARLERDGAIELFFDGEAHASRKANPWDEAEQ